MVDVLAMVLDLMIFVNRVHYHQMVELLFQMLTVVTVLVLIVGGCHQPGVVTVLVVVILIQLVVHILRQQNVKPIVHYLDGHATVITIVHQVQLVHMLHSIYVRTLVKHRL